MATANWSRQFDDARSSSELLVLVQRASEREYRYETGRPSYNHAIAILHGRGTREIFAAAEAMTRHPAAHRRALACLLLGQLERGGVVTANETEAALLALLKTERVSNVRSDALTALGHTRRDSEKSGWENVESNIRRFVSDRDPAVRGSLAFALMKSASDALNDVLLILMDDPQSVRARDWSTTNFRSYPEKDSATIRDALLRRAREDADTITRSEALQALAKRKDMRIAPLLVAEFERGIEVELEYSFIAAACELLFDDKDRKETVENLVMRLCSIS